MQTQMYSKYEPRECARCHKTHICTLTIHCSCMEAEISEETMDQISYHFDDCLCADCLKELEKN